MTASWQLVLLWGVLVGVGTGSISMGFVATVATRWFEARRGLVTGVLTVLCVLCLNGYEGKIGRVKQNTD